MSKRFFTADFHFGMSILLNRDIVGNDVRPFKTIDDMNSFLIQMCNQNAKIYYKQKKEEYDGNLYVDNVIVDKDIIIHIGDLACFKSDRNEHGLNIKPSELIQKINANFINIRGNHDINNKVKSLCNSMQTSLGKKFLNVTVGHYPSYDVHAKDTFKEGWIHLCGHVHKAWKHCLDTTHKVLNINVGVDVWNYNIVSEDQLIKYIERVLLMPKEKINKIKIENNKIIKM